VKLSSREAMLVLTVGAVGIFGGSAMLVKPRIDAWKELQKEQAGILAQIERDSKLVAERDKWMKRLEKLSEMLPQHASDEKMDVHWLSVMDNLASKHGVRISKRQAGEERRQGDVYELPIECKDWEGSLDSVIHFLFDLQSAGAMLDVRQLLVKPKGKGVLRGRFLLYCAYTREPESQAR